MPDFALQEIKIPNGTSKLAPVDSASITIVTAGSGSCQDMKLAPGVVFYMSAGQSAELTIDQDLIAYRAFVK